MTAPVSQPGVGDASRPADPNYILSQDEFGAGVRTIYAGILDQGDRTRSVLSREADDLVATAGWVCISLAFWLLFIGFYAVRGDLRGRP